MQSVKTRCATRFGRADLVVVRAVAVFGPLRRSVLDLSFWKGGDPTLNLPRFLNLKTGRV